MSHADIRTEILDNWEQLSEHPEPTDLLDEFADSANPVYYNEILKDWSEMPSEYNDSWQEFGQQNNATIFSLMAIDLAVYYRAIYGKIYAEILEEKAGN
jgi:hypothetical protein